MAWSLGTACGLHASEAASFPPLNAPCGTDDGNARLLAACKGAFLHLAGLMADVEQAQHDGQPKLRRFSYCYALLRVLSELTSLTARLLQGGVGVGELGGRERGKERPCGCYACHARCECTGHACLVAATLAFITYIPWPQSTG